MKTPQSRGFTLLELIVTLVILSVAVAAIAGLVANLSGRSADPVIQTQAIYIAEGYLEEAALKAYSDPEGDEEDCSSARSGWDDITDYGRCLSSAAPPSDPFGATLAGLSSYSVSMSVAGETSSVGGVGTGVNSRLVSVSVTHSAGGVAITLATLRAQPVTP